MIEFFVKRPISVLVFCVGLSVLGWISYQRIPVQLMPEMNVPEFKILTSWATATAEEIETQITIPIEKSTSTLAGLKSTSSKSYKGQSEILLKFKSNIDIPKTVSEIRDRIDSVSLPDGAKRSRINRFQSSSLAVSEYLFQGKENNRSLSDIQIELNEGIKRELEKIDGVALVQILGAPKKSLEIEVNPIAMQAFALNIQSIADSILNQNRSSQAGQIAYLGSSIPVKVGRQLNSKDDLLDINLKAEGTKVIRLGEIAKLNSIDQVDNKIRLNSQPALMIQIKKEAEANTVSVGNKVRDKLLEYANQKKEDLTIVSLSDQAKEIELAIDNVKESVITGAVLAALIIYLLLQSGWTSFVITVAIPISLMMTLVMMYFTGVSFNLMSLAGLALGVGMLVDNSTVVLGSISEHGLKTKSIIEAAIFGTKSVSSAITSSTLSTIAVFAPLVFIEGEIGFLFRDVALTVCYSILSSLIVAIIVIPCLSTQSNNPAKNKTLSEFSFKPPLHASWLENIQYSFTIHVESISHAVNLLRSKKVNFTYLNATKIIIKKIHDKVLSLVHSMLYFFEKKLDYSVPYWADRVFLSGALIITASIAGILIISSLGSDLFPEEQVNKIEIQLQFPASRVSEKNEEQLNHLEAGLAKLTGIQSYVIQNQSTSSSKYLLTILTRHGQIGPVTKNIIRLLAGIPDLKFNRQKQAVFGSGKPIQIVFEGENLLNLKNNTEITERNISDLPGISDIESNLDNWSEQIQVNLSPEKMSYMGVDPSSFITLTQSLLDTTTLPSLTFGPDTFEVRAKTAPSYIKDIDSIGNISLDIDDGKRIYLRQVSTIKSQNLPSELRRQDRTRVAIIEANLDGWDLEKATEKIAEKMKTLGIDWKFGGQKEEQKNSTHNLMIAILFSIFLIYLISASQFESLSQPIVVLLAVPSSIIGVAIFLILFGLNFSALVLVGFIILVGASVNTSIVMVDYANQLMMEGSNAKDAILLATKKRMRSIVVTTAANILGLIPMAFSFGEPGSSMQQPLSVTLIGGLLSSTLITLIVVPAFYVLARRNDEHAT